MEEPGGPVAEPVPPERPVPLPEQDGWRTVYFGQVSRELVPYHPEPPEAPEDELTREALEDPAALQQQGAGNPAPTLWRLIVVLLVAVGALAVVFWR
jgi:hypothetical protein